MQNEKKECIDTSPEIACESINTKVESWLKGGHANPQAKSDNESQKAAMPFIVVEQINCIPAENQVSPPQSVLNEADALFPNTNLLKVDENSDNLKQTIHGIAKMKSWIKHWKTQVHVNDNNNNTNTNATNSNETMSELLATVIPPDQLLSIVQEALPIVQNICRLYRWQLGRDDRLTQLADSQIIHIQTLEKKISKSVNND